MGYKKKKSKIFSLGAILAFATTSTCTVPQTTLKKNVVAIKNQERPHYLQSLPSEFELKQMSPLEKVTETYWLFLRDSKKNENNSTTVLTNLCAKANVNINGQNVNLILPLYKQLTNGAWEYVVDNKKVNKNVIVNDLKHVLEEAVELAYSEFKGISLKSNAKIKQIFLNADTDAFNIIPGTSLSYRDVFGLLNLKKEDFLPNNSKVYFAPLPSGILGVTYVNEHKVLYSPTARRHDAIWGKPFVLAHEFVHNNVLLQGFPVPLANDVEMQAFQMNMTNSDKIFNFLIHGYAHDLRRYAKVYFGVDSREIMDNLIEDSVYKYVTLNDEEWKKAVVKIRNVSERLNKLIMNESYPEFMAFTPWWLIVNNYLKNAVAPIDITIARKLEPVNNYEYRKVMVDMRQTVDNIINRVNSKYKMPILVKTLFGNALTGPNYRQLLANECMKSGFNRNEFELIYHLALKKRFLKKDGKINYSAITLKQAQVSLDDIMYSFNKLRSVKYINKKPAFKKKLELYNWFRDRLNLANRYYGFALTYGSKVSPDFVPKIFDPRINLTRLYRFMPGYIKHANNKNKVFVTMIDSNKDGLIDYKIVGYDVIKDVGSEQGVDYVEVYKGTESKARIIAFASNGSKKLNMALIERDYQGSKDYGNFDSAVIIDGLNGLNKMLK